MQKQWQSLPLFLDILAFSFKYLIATMNPLPSYHKPQKEGEKKQKMGLTGAGQDVWIVAKQPDRIGVCRPIVTNPPPNYLYSYSYATCTICLIRCF